MWWWGVGGQFSAVSDPTQVGISVGDPDEGGFLSSPGAAQVHPGLRLATCVGKEVFLDPLRDPGWF